jgi:hypothetical protein
MSSSTHAPNAQSASPDARVGRIKKCDLDVEWTAAKADDAESSNGKFDDSSRSLYVEWPEAKGDATSTDIASVPTNRKSSMNTASSTVTCQSSRSAKSNSTAKTKTTLSSAASFISMGLLQEKEHTESSSSNRSLGGRNISSGQLSARANTSRRGKRLSDLTSSSNWDEEDEGEDDDDDDDESVNLEDLQNGPDEAGLEKAGSSRSVFNNFLVRVKESSSKNLSAMTDLLAQEVGDAKHQSTYFKERVSLRVRRASDLLFSSHHKQGCDDVSGGNGSSHHEDTLCTNNHTGNQLHDCDVDSDEQRRLYQSYCPS